MADQWTWYRAAIAGEKVDITTNKVESGFYYTKASKAGGRVPVAIWRGTDGAFNCRVGTKQNARVITEDDATTKWTWIGGNPIERDLYKIAFETGVWPDGTPTVAPDAAASGKSNEIVDPFERLQAEIADKMASAEAWMKAHPEAKTKTEADYATNMQREINALVKQADAMHETEKAPHLAATRAVDDKFRFRDKMKSVGSALKGIFERFLVAQEQFARKSAQAKFEAERRAAEIARSEVEKARAKLMRDDPIQALTSPEPEMPEPPLAPEPVKVQSGGGVGNRAGLKSVWVATIEDHHAALMHFKDAPDILDALEKLVNANTRLNKGATRIPGVKVAEQRKVA